MRKRLLSLGLVFLFLIQLSPRVSAQNPTISPDRVKARKELGQLFVEYSKESFIKQASEGDTLAVQLFIAAGMDPNSKDKDGTTALIAATKNGFLETVQALVAGGADVKARTGTGWSVLNYTIRTDILTFLLDKGAEVNAKDLSGQTPLMFAAENGSGDAVKLLIERGADPNAKDRDGRTALMRAAAKNYAEAVKALLEKGVDVNAVSTHNQTALFAVASENQNADTAKLLLANGANVNARNDSGITPLHRAAARGRTEVAKALLESGVDVNVLTNDGWTPLMYASVYGHIEVVKALLDKGADVNVRNQRGSALSLASGQNKTDIVQLLIAAGAKQ